MCVCVWTFAHGSGVQGQLLGITSLPTPNQHDTQTLSRYSRHTHTHTYMQGPRENLAAPWQPIPMATNGMGFFFFFCGLEEWEENEGKRRECEGDRYLGEKLWKRIKIERRRKWRSSMNTHTYTHTIWLFWWGWREREIQTVTTLWVKGDLPPGWSQQALRSTEERCGVVFWGEKKTLRLKINEKVITFCEMVQLRKLQCRCFMHTGY